MNLAYNIPANDKTGEPRFYVRREHVVIPSLSQLREIFETSDILSDAELDDAAAE